MTDALPLASGTLSLFLVLVFAAMAASLALRLLRPRLARRGWSDWLAEHETTVVAAIWAALVLVALAVGPRLMLAWTGMPSS